MCIRDSVGALPDDYAAAIRMLRDLDEAADARAEPSDAARGARRPGARVGAPPAGDDDANRLAKLAAEDATRGDDAEAEEGPGGGEEIDGPDDHAGEVADWSSLASGPLQEEAPRADASPCLLYTSPSPRDS